VEGVNSSMIYLIHCKNLCKCHIVLSTSTIRKKKKAYAYTQKMAEEELSAYSVLHFLSPVINHLSLPSSCLFIWYLGARGQTWHVEVQEFEASVQNSSFNDTSVKIRNG
jgi:hypothetical protein